MSERFNYFYNVLRNKSTVVIYLIAFVCLIALIPILNLIYVKIIGLDFENSSISKNRDLFSEFFVKVIAGPIIETILFQKLPIDFSRSRSFVKRYKMMPVLLSAMIFGAMHFGSFYHIVYAFHMGLILAGFYYIMVDKQKNALIHTSGLHMLFNFSLFLGRNL